MSYHRMRANTGYYQIGGYMSHSHFWYQWDQPKMVKDFMSLDQHGLDLVLGINKYGASYLLLPLQQFDAQNYSLRLQQPKKSPFPRSNFLSLSPIHFSTPQDFTDRLNFHKQPANKKRNFDASKANSAFSGLNSDLRLGPPRAAYENNRLFYQILQGHPLDFTRFGISRPLAANAIKFLSLTFNIWEMEETYPNVLDFGWCLPGLPSSPIGATGYTHVISHEFRTFGNPEVQKADFKYGTTDILDRDARAERLRALFAELQGSDFNTPIVVFVYDESITRAVLKEHGLDTATWHSGIGELLHGDPYSHGDAYRDHRYSRNPQDDDRYSSSRRRSRSPRRSNQPYDPRRRSPPPAASARSAPIYLVDVRSLYDTVKGLPSRGRRPLLATAAALGVDVDQKVWNAGNESRILVEMWAAIASGPDIVDRHKAMLAVESAMPSVSVPVIPAPASVPAPDSADVDPNDIDPNGVDPNDVDPNDVVPAATNAGASGSTGPRQHTMAYYLDGNVDDDDDEEYAF